MKQNTQPIDQGLYNTQVEHAYHLIVKQAKALLSCLARDELRCILERKNPVRLPNSVIHEIVSPLLYVRLSCAVNGAYTIHFGIEPIKENAELNTLTAQFLRILFTHTGKGATGCDIEDCIQTDWFINCCSDMYEYSELKGEQNRNHTLKKVPYKGLATKRKKVLEVV